MEVPFGRFRGLNNQNPDFGQDFVDLTRADNCDLDNERRLRRRKGITQLSPTATHSLFSNEDFALFRQGTSLYRMKDDFASGTVIKTGLTAGATMRYFAAPGRVFMSDGLFAGQTDGSRVRNWGIAVPIAQPAAAATSGALPRGKYQYALTYLRDDGEESGTPRAGVIECAGGITFSAIPVSGDPDVVAKAIYVTRPGGKKWGRALKIANAVTSATYTGDALDTTLALQTQFKGPPVAGSVLGYHNARALVGYGAFLLYSDAYRPELFHPDSHVAFTAGVRFAVGVRDGVWVGTGAEVVFLRGADIKDADFELKAKTAVMRDACAMVNGERVLKNLSGVVAVFMTEHGTCVGTENGELIFVTQDIYQPVSATQGVACVRSTGANVDQYLVILR